MRAPHQRPQAGSPTNAPQTLITLFACLMLLSPAPCGAQVEIEGVVQLPRARTEPVMTSRYEIVTRDGIVSTEPPIAVVYLEGNFPPPATPSVRRITQRDFTFVPAVLPIEIGTRVEFPNEDDAYHNIFSYSRPKRFDLGRYRPDERPVPSVVFDEPGLITLRCDIHEHMRAIILVLTTPHFVLSDTAGNYRLTGLPPGTYTLKAWLNSKTTHESIVQLEPDSKIRVDFP